MEKSDMPPSPHSLAGRQRSGEKMGNEIVKSIKN